MAKTPQKADPRRVTTAQIFQNDTKGLIGDWLAELRTAGADSRIAESEVRGQAEEFLGLITAATTQGLDVASPAWQRVREFLERTARSRALQGFSTEETATFVFSLKKPVFARIRRMMGNDLDGLARETWTISEMVDKLGLHIANTFQKAREEVIARQQEELLELSTPVVKLWDGVLALPMIGTLDSARTQVVMESLLQRIVETGAEIAIIDITGVPTVDTLVAQHLLKTVTAIRLMGADCIISGIRPQIAQTIVHLGVELHGVTTKANLADALALALKRAGLTVTKTKAKTE
jgi:rsbT co-antagonist protein RsbR